MRHSSLAYASVLIACLSVSPTWSFVPTAATKELSRLHATDKDPTGNDADGDPSLGRNLRRAFLASSAAAGAQVLWANAAPLPGASDGTKFRRVSPIQFVAATGDPEASSGTGAADWGLWPVDPGPRGVTLREYPGLAKSGGRTPAGWTFDRDDWWLEEHGLIMEPPSFPMAPGKYLVTGGRKVTTSLTIRDDGSWLLGDIGDDVKLFDVTHLPCRAARYRPAPDGSPETANPRDFPVTPGAVMPEVKGCSKKDYAVLFVIGKAA